jgi:2-polyprenyl-6-methoxyphenol hydroxylase-like FAD-dependent oxidoreductase
MAPPLHVLIAGGGLAGLCLAQGLKRAGVSSAVYERDPDMRRPAGYRITINGDGGNALQACLPDDLYELYLQASRNTPPRRMSVVVSSQCEELTTAPHFGAPNEGERPHTAIHRRTLRQILAARLGDTIRPAAKAVGFERDGDTVRLLLEDGTSAEGDVLVGADGVYSAVRRALMPDVEVIDTGVRGLGVFARTPLPPEVHDGLPEILLSGFVIAVDPATGVTLAMGAMDPRRPPEEAAADVAPDVELDPVAPYMMLSGGIRPGTPIPAPDEWTDATPGEVHAQMVEAVAGWHPALRGLVERIELDSMFASHFMRLDPTPPWEPSNVTLAGDAIHAMLPTMGMGGNTSLRDAAVLAEKLAAAQRGDLDLVAAIGAYEEDMRGFAYPVMEMSADHDRFGGGGLRQREPVERS